MASAPPPSLYEESSVDQDGLYSQPHDGLYSQASSGSSFYAVGVLPGESASAKGAAANEYLVPAVSESGTGRSRPGNSAWPGGSLILSSSASSRGSWGRGDWSGTMGQVYEDGGDTANASRSSARALAAPPRANDEKPSTSTSQRILYGLAVAALLLACAALAVAVVALVKSSPTSSSPTAGSAEVAGSSANAAATAALNVSTTSALNALNATLAATQAAQAVLDATLHATVAAQAALNATLTSALANTTAAQAVLSEALANTTTAQAVLASTLTSAVRGLNATLMTTIVAENTLNTTLISAQASLTHTHEGLLGLGASVAVVQAGVVSTQASVGNVQTALAGLATSLATGMTNTQASVASVRSSVVDTQASVAAVQASLAVDITRGTAITASVAVVQTGLLATQASAAELQTGVVNTQASAVNVQAALTGLAASVASVQMGLSSTQASVASVQAGLSNTQALLASVEATVLAAIALGSSPSYPASSCNQVYQARTNVTNATVLTGLYWMQYPDSAAPVQVFCHMAVPGLPGGWDLIMKMSTSQTLQYASDLWTTTNTLNPTLNMDATFGTDNKYEGYNYGRYSQLYVRFNFAGSTPTTWDWPVTNLTNSSAAIPAVMTPLSYFTGPAQYLFNETSILSSAYFTNGGGNKWTAQGGFQKFGVNACCNLDFCVRLGFVFNNENHCESNDASGGLGLAATDGGRGLCGAGDYGNSCGCMVVYGANACFTAQVYARRLF